MLDVLVRAHSDVGELTGPGRPLDVSKPLAHAYAIAVVAEFQGFTQDLHDLTAATIVAHTGAPASLVAILTEGLTLGRQLDRGNADLRSIKADFARLGLTPLDLAEHNQLWSRGDSSQLPRIFDLRNALAHGNRVQLSRLRQQDVLDTVTWVRGRLPVLNRLARSLDHLVWNHLRDTVGVDPW